MKKYLNHTLRLFLLTAIMTCLMAAGVNAAQTGIITGDVVNARKGPGTGYERVEMLAKGKQVTILGEENGWYHIAWGNDKGYVLSDYVAASGSSSSSQTSASANATVKGGTINVRSGPGTGYSRVAMVSSGKRVAVLDKDGSWYHVSFDGKTGYILSDYLTVDGSAAPKATATTSTTAQTDTSGNATVKGGATINVRSGPGTSYNRVAQVTNGKRVTLLGEEGGWYKITFSSKTGYILGDYLQPDAGVLEALSAKEAASAAAEAPAQPAAEAPAETPAETAQSESAAEPAQDAIPIAAAEATSVASDGTEGAPETEETRSGIITGGTINVRTGPGTNYERITRVSTGKRVNIIGEENGWFKISFGDTTGYVLSDYVYEGDSLPASSVGEQVAALAQQYLGVRYVYGGASPSGFDCSGLTMYLYKQFGYSLPHTASGQYANCGRKVSRSELQPGDLVFFSSSGSGGRITHAGVYIGGGEFIHARMSVGKVYRNSLSEAYYSKYLVGAIRIA